MLLSTRAAVPWLSPLDSSNTLTIMPWRIAIRVRVFAKDPGDWGSILGWVISNTQKMWLDTTLFNSQHYKVLIKGYWINPGKGVAPSSTLRCSSYWKGSFRVTLEYSQPTCCLYIYIYIYIYMTMHIWMVADICLWVRIYIYIYACMNLCVYMCVCLYV